MLHFIIWTNFEDRRIWAFLEENLETNKGRIFEKMNKQETNSQVFLWRYASRWLDRIPSSLTLSIHQQNTIHTNVAMSQQ